MRNSSVIGRVAAVAAVVVAIVAVAVILLSSGTTYTVRADFQNASQIVQGDLVEVAGNPVGTVSKIAITPDGLAQLSLGINNPAYQHLPRGPRRSSARPRCRASPTATSTSRSVRPATRRSPTTA